MFRTIQVRLNVSDQVLAYLTHQCQQSNNLNNCAVFQVRQKHFESCERVEFFDKDGFYRSEFKTKRVQASYPELCKSMTDNPHYKALGGQCAQQTLKSVVESFSSFNGLLKLFWQGEANKPKMPRYRTKGGLAPISFPAQALSFDVETGECRIPISRELSPEVKEHLTKSEIKINGAYGISHEQIVELRIIPKNNEFYAEYVYKYGNAGSSGHLALDCKQALGIDHGVDNWLTCVSTKGKSFIVDGRKLKSINQNYNRRVSSIKQGKTAKYWDFELARITEKRNRVMRDAINKTARFIVNHCINNRLGTLVFGWNTKQKDGSNMGKKNNQEFVQIPSAKLKNRIQQLCEEVGIQFVETEESYTSKSSFLDNDFLPTYGEKPKSWKPSGKRGKKGDGIGRGQYKTAQNVLINSDCNGAANILRKVSIQLSLDLAKVCRAVLNLPKRYDLFDCLTGSYRRRCVGCLQTP